MPVIVSVLVFIIYYIIDNTGYKMARDGKWIVWMGMWTSSAVLAPLGVFLTYKSNKDSVVLNADAYINWFKKIEAGEHCGFQTESKCNPEFHTGSSESPSYDGSICQCKEKYCKESDRR